MKLKDTKVIAGCALFAIFALNSFGQSSSSKEGLQTTVKLEKNKVPKEVTEPFYREYPITTYENWYGLKAYDYKSDWFDNWYDYDTYRHHVETPQYYVVEFSNDKTKAKVIYSKSGGKVAFHKSLNTELPKDVIFAISKGIYKNWKIGNDKEEIYKDSDKDLLKVYKVTVEKGKEKHTLFFQPDGKLLKDKKES